MFIDMSDPPKGEFDLRPLLFLLNRAPRATIKMRSAWSKDDFPEVLSVILHRFHDHIELSMGDDDWSYDTQ